MPNWLIFHPPTSPTSAWSRQILVLSKHWKCPTVQTFLCFLLRHNFDHQLHLQSTMQKSRPWIRSWLQEMRKCSRVSLSSFWFKLMIIKKGTCLQSIFIHILYSSWSMINQWVGWRQYFLSSCSLHCLPSFN